MNSIVSKSQFRMKLADNRLSIEKHFSLSHRFRVAMSVGALRANVDSAFRLYVVANVSQLAPLNELREEIIID